MSIAEQIMLGTQQQSKNWSVLSDSIGQLGQQIGQSLENKEYQNQVQAVLPMMQATYRNAFDKIGKGNLSEGYSDLMDAQLQYGSSTNPFIQNMNKQMAEMSKQYADDYLRKSQIDAYEGRYSGGTGGGGGGIPAGPSAFFGTNPADTEPLPTDPNLAQPVEEMPQGDGGAMPQGDGGAMPEFTGQFSAGLNEPTQELPWSYQNPNAIQPTSEVKKSFEKNKQEYLGVSPDKQKTYQNNLSSTTVPKGTNISQFDFSNIKSLQNVVGIAAPVERQVEVPESMTITESNKGTSYSTKFNKKTTNEVVITKSNDLVLTDLPKSLGLISSNKTLAKYFRENDLGKLDIGIKAKKGGKEESYYIGIDGKKDSYTTISRDDFVAASIIQNLPSSARTLDSTFIITDQPMEKAANMSREDQVKKAQELLGITQPETETAPSAPATTETPPTPQFSQENPFAKSVSEKETQKETDKKRSIETEKTNIQNSILDLENKIKILTAVGQRNPEMLPDYLRRRMGNYMSATPSRNAKDFEDTKNKLAELKTKLKSF